MGLFPSPVNLYYAGGGERGVGWWWVDGRQFGSLNFPQFQNNKVMRLLKISKSLSATFLGV